MGISCFCHLWNHVRVLPTQYSRRVTVCNALRLAFADRGLYVADADFVDVPVDGLIDPAYLMSRAQLIDPAKSRTKAPVSVP